jgi:hypothetical protein
MLWLSAAPPSVCERPPRAVGSMRREPFLRTIQGLA